MSVALRAVAVAACLALAVLPARVAVSQARFGDSLAALQRGDCPAATAAAARSLEALGRRAAPHHMVGWCELRAERRWAAVAALAQARRNLRSLYADPRELGAVALTLLALAGDSALAIAARGGDARGSSGAAQYSGHDQ